MTIYDGTSFGAIDDTAYADGRPSDEWLRRKIENNVTFLTITEPPVTVLRKGGDLSPLDASAFYYGDRAIASFQRTIFICQPIWVTPNLTEVRMHLAIRSKDAFSSTSTSAVKIDAFVEMCESRRRIGSIGASTFDDDRDYDDIGLTTYAIPVAPTGEGWAVVCMCVQSTLDDGQTSTKSAADHGAAVASDGLIQLTFTGGSALYVPATNPTPATSYPFDHGVVENDLTQDVSDILAFWDLGEVAGSNQGVKLLVPKKSTPGIGGAMTDLGVLPLSYLQMRSYTVELVNRYNLRDAELVYGVPERGLDNLRHAQSVRSLRGRRRLVAGGPQGYLPDWRPTIQGRHHQIWRSAYGGPSGPSQPITTLLKVGAPEPLSDGTVVIVLLVAGAVHNGTGRGTCQWKFDTTIDNWVSTKTATTTRDIATIGTQTAWALIGPSDTELGGSWLHNIMRGTFIADGATRAYAVRDGQMTPSDLGTLSTVTIEVDVPASGASVGYDIEVTAQCVGNIDGLATGRDPLASQHLALVGYAVYLQPNEEA